MLSISDGLMKRIILSFVDMTIDDILKTYWVINIESRKILFLY